LMKVLALASYPIEAAATRYRLEQFVAPLKERGITLDVRPFVDSRLFASLYRRDQMPRNAVRVAASTLRRFGDVVRARRADVILVQREAMMFGPPVIEWLTTRLEKRPLVLDLDDATYVSYTSPTYGRLASSLKWFSKTDDMIRWAQVVTCGNRYIAEYVSSKGTQARIIPTVVDTERFRPAPAKEDREPLVVGWIGTHSTFTYLEAIFPALQELALHHRFRLKIVGAGLREIELPGVEVESLDWSMQREIEDFQSLDIGLYPITPDEWAVGKSGFKAIQYMAVGVPFVVSPVGICAEIGVAGETHLHASSQEEWVAALGDLLVNAEKRKRMGAAGRRHATEHYTVPIQADKLAGALREAATRAAKAQGR
jgi:glycosyltransferase involved in cell wall biosynthesis